MLRLQILRSPLMFGFHESFCRSHRSDLDEQGKYTFCHIPLLLNSYETTDMLDQSWESQRGCREDRWHGAEEEG